MFEHQSCVLQQQLDELLKGVNTFLKGTSSYEGAETVHQVPALSAVTGASLKVPSTATIVPNVAPLSAVAAALTPHV